MFCKNCGKELADDAKFCPVCGAKREGTPVHTSAQDMGTKATEEQLNMRTMPAQPEADGNKTGSSKANGNIISRIWNSPLFTKVAIKFGNILEIVEGITFVILARFLFQEKGFWGYAFGILFGLGGLASCINGVMALISRKKNGDAGELPDEAAINKKKKNLCIGTVVIIIALLVVVKTGGGTYTVIRSVSFDDIGTETIGELVDENIKAPEWSQRKLDGDTKLVYVEGYCPDYGQTIRIEFYYEKTGDGSFEVSLNGISWPDSGEELGALEAAILWASFYE